MPKIRSEQMDFKGLEIVADEFTGTLNGTATPPTFSQIPGTVSDVTGTNLQAILNSIASRLVIIENS